MTVTDRRRPAWRWIAAALVVAAFWAVPAPVDLVGGTEAWTSAAVRRWLLDEDSPLDACVRGERLGPLQVDLRTSPPITDAADAKRRAAEYASCPQLWLLRQPHGEQPAFDPAAPASSLLVRVGERGARAELARPDGTTSSFEVDFPARWSLLPAFVAVAVATLLGGVLPWLLGGAVAALTLGVAMWPVLPLLG